VSLANTGALFTAVTFSRLELNAIEVANRLPDASVALTVTEIAPAVPAVDLGATGKGFEIMRFSRFIGYQRISVKPPVSLSVLESTS
jgi:hypothetical protein